MENGCDVLVVGSGNAGLSAALAARQNGASVCLVDKAPEDWAGGNSYFTAGAYRMAHAGPADLAAWVSTDGRGVDDLDLPIYDADDYFADMLRLTQGRTDQTLARVLADEAADAARWLASHGVQWELMYHRQSFIKDGKAAFWGNLPVGAVGGGKGLIAAELASARTAGVRIRFGTAFLRLVHDQGHVTGAVVSTPEGEESIACRAVVLASGGFQGDARRRAMYLGPGWDLAKVRGTPHNTGDGIFAALDVGADPHGHWSGCHAIAWDLAAPDHGARGVTNRYSRQSYPYGLVVNNEGLRFVDEGADFRNYTYAKYGQRILQQPSHVAYQLFDAKTLKLTSDIDYSTAVDSRWEADTVAGLAQRIDVPADALVETIDAYNQAIRPGAFDPTVKDGRGTEGIQPAKSNWAQPFDSPPYVAFGVACGITFTFGGVRIDPHGRVMNKSGGPIAGLYACGEAVGGLFYHNYPGGSGLAAGAVFGRRSGTAAATDRVGGAGQ